MEQLYSILNFLFIAAGCSFMYCLLNVMSLVLRKSLHRAMILLTQRCQHCYVDPGIKDTPMRQRRNAVLPSVESIHSELGLENSLSLNLGPPSPRFFEERGGKKDCSSPPLNSNLTVVKETTKKSQITFTLQPPERLTRGQSAGVHRMTTVLPLRRHISVAPTCSSTRRKSYQDCGGVNVIELTMHKADIGSSDDEVT